MPGAHATLTRRSLRALAGFVLLFAVALFLPAGSPRYWQAWVYWLITSAFYFWITLYFLKRDPALLERRLRAGPTAERQTSQKVIQAFASLAFLAEIIVPGFDYRFRWSRVPPALVIMCDIITLVGVAIVFLTLRANSFASATIEIAKNQRVIDTGPYRIVRHPMYSGALLAYAVTPLALGSYWALLPFLLMLLALGWRIREEERFLANNLPGYPDYLQRTPCRLIPHVW